MTYRIGGLTRACAAGFYGATAGKIMPATADPRFVFACRTADAIYAAAKDRRASDRMSRYAGHIAPLPAWWRFTVLKGTQGYSKAPNTPLRRGDGR